METDMERLMDDKEFENEIEIQKNLRPRTFL